MKGIFVEVEIYCRNCKEKKMGYCFLTLRWFRKLGLTTLELHSYFHQLGPKAQGTSKRAEKKGPLNISFSIMMKIARFFLETCVS